MRTLRAPVERQSWPRPATYLFLHLIVGLTALSTTGNASAAICAPYGTDQGTVAAARSTVAAACDCSSAASRTEWRACVTTALDALRNAGKLSRSCMAHVLRVETDSTCGRPGFVVCCRTWEYITRSHVLSFIRPSGHCGPADAYPDSCESPLARVSEACSVLGCTGAPQALVRPERCGNGRRDPGEECDPPDDRTCSTWCRRCPERTDALSIGCSDIDEAGVATAAASGEFLVTHSEGTRNGSRVVATRIDHNGRIISHALPVATDDTTRRPPVYTESDSMTADGAGFYVGWYDDRGRSANWLGRRVAASGAVNGDVAYLDGWVGGIGSCGQTYVHGPMGLAPSLDGTTVHHTIRSGSTCAGLEELSGVPFQFDPVPSTDRRLVGSTGPGRLARGAHDVAALWWTVEIPDYLVQRANLTLYAGWVEPNPAAFALLAVAAIQSGSTGLAVVGDTFLAAYATATEIRGIRFSRTAGVLDPGAGLVVAKNLGNITEVVATSDGQRFVVAWRETRARGDVVRVVRVEESGKVVDGRPIDVVQIDRDAPFSVAAEASAMLVAYTKREESGATSVRAVTVPERRR